MQNSLKIWAELGGRRQALAVLAAAALLAALFVLGRLVSMPSMALLYAGLEPSAAGEVVRALDQRGLRYQVRGDSIWVAENERDQLRMSLAGEGLPASGGAGYELLDALSGFGTTAQMFDAAWLRAKEGELARTIATSPQVKSARVHLAVPSARPFQRDLKPSASVNVTSVSGTLPAAQAQAIRHLVSSAVAGLEPGQVSVIDAAGGLVEPVAAGNARSEEARGEELRRSVERLLAARVGPGRAMVEVAVELVTDQESLRERRIEPESRIVISTDSENRSSSASGAPPGVTVASNLPEGDAPANEGSRSQEEQSRERINYEVSETARELVRAPGGILRLSVAVLVDGLRAADGTWQPRGTEEMADLRELVASAVGYNEARGDVITLKTLEFDLLPEGQASVFPGFLERVDVMSLIQIAIVALVFIAMLAFVVRPLLAGRRVSPAVPTLPEPPQLEALSGEISSGHQDEAREDLLRIGLSDSSVGQLSPDPLERLRQLISERQVETTEILRSWMDEREESH